MLRSTTFELLVAPKRPHFTMPLVVISASGYPERQRHISSTAFVNGLKPVVFIGRLLGVLSRNDVLKNQETHRSINFPLVYSGFLASFFFTNALLLARDYITIVLKKPSTSEKLGELSVVFYAFTMSFLYAYLLFATKRFRNLVINFEQGDYIQPPLPTFPQSFPRFCWIICITCMLFGVAENAFYDVQKLVKGGKANSTTLQLYYKENFHHWSEFIPYHPILTLIFVIIVKCGTWGWVYGDIIPIVFAKGLTSKLETLNKKVEQTMTPSLERKIFTTTWSDIQDDFLMLSKLALEVQRFISPIILSCYAVTVYTIMSNLFHWITPYNATTVERSHYVYFAFMNFLFRVTSVTYFVAEVHHTSGSIVRTIQCGHNSQYTLSLKRLEQTLVCNPIGIHLFGSFVISRKSFISLLSFLFTTEIVLLQTVKD